MSPSCLVPKILPPVYRKKYNMHILIHIHTYACSIKEGCLIATTGIIIIMNSLEIKGRLWCQKVKWLCRMLCIHQPLIHFEVEHYIFNCCLCGLQPDPTEQRIPVREATRRTSFLHGRPTGEGVTTRWQHCMVMWQGYNIMVDNISDVSVDNDRICNIYAENE